MTNNTQFLIEQVEELKEQGIYRKLPTMESPSGPEVTLNGKENIINLSANNYLGFATDERLKEAAKEAIDKYGVGTGSVRTIIGNLDLHEELEETLAEFKKEDRVFLFQSGFNCNAGTIQAITDKGDLIISDELNHASIIDGVRLSRADKKIYKHSDMEELRKILEENRKDYENCLIITDGVFSMDGDLAKLPEIVELAKEFNCMTYVDDAHGSGVLGEHGRGTVDHFGLHGQVDFIVGTLSKAIGVIGGYVACSEETYEWLDHRARPVLFSTSMTPADVAACKKSVEILLETDQYQKRLWDNGDYFKEKMSGLGFDIGNSETPITPVIIGDEAKTMEFSRKLLDEGVFVSAIVFPTVPQGTGRLRCMLSAAHSKEELDRATKAFEKVGKELGVI